MKTTKIFGPPGTGKTTRLLGIMEAELAAGVEPERLAYLTFTVAARAEAKRRAVARFGFEERRLKWFRTLHSVAYELLGVTKGALATARELEGFGALYGYEFSGGLQFTDEGLPVFGHGRGDKLLSFDHFRRHRLAGWDAAYGSWQERENIGRFEVKRFCEGYERWKGDDGWVDFTDLLERGTGALPCEVVIVDEAQDLSPLQWKTLWRFAAQAERVYIAGDDDQAIYEWAGADAATFLSQDADVVEVLPRSHRCPRRVTELARRVIERVRDRQPKDWQARDEDGELVRCASVDMLEPRPDTLYLYRNHKFAEQVTAHLKSLGEPYTIGKVRSVDPAAAAAILTWEGLRNGRPAKVKDLEYVLNLCSPRVLPPAARHALRTSVGADDAVPASAVPPGLLAHPWFTVLDKLKENEFYLRKVVQRGGRKALTEQPRIRLSTIHGAKGAEEEHVVLMTDMTGLVRKSLDRHEAAERRVWYVGLTRARKSLALVGNNNPLI